MASDCFIVLDEHRSVFNLILLIISDKTEVKKSNRDDRDRLLVILTDEKLRLEDAKMILYLFCHQCSLSAEEVTVDEYLKTTGRTMQNKDPIRRSVKRLSDLRIIYLDHNGKRQEQKLFKTCVFKRGKITYQINSFFESKLNIRGRGHKEQKVKAFLFKDEQFRSYRYNSVRLVVILDLMYCLNDSNSIDKEILVSETESLITLINKYFDHRIRHLILWIDQSSKELLKYYTRS